MTLYSYQSFITEIKYLSLDHFEKLLDKIINKPTVWPSTIMQSHHTIITINKYTSISNEKRWRHGRYIYSKAINDLIF